MRLVALFLAPDKTMKQSAEKCVRGLVKRADKGHFINFLLYLFTSVLSLGEICFSTFIYGDYIHLFSGFYSLRIRILL